ncbi:MAG: radical SAM protein [Ardenticatenaceae bacterium]|nr:radical SAM protein [Ardenticatenaceae bacterium]
MTLELRPLGVKCNIQCQYCYQNPQRDAGNVLHLYDLEKMKATALELGGSFTLFGGEPLLLPEKDLEDIWAWGYARNGRNGIQTNGVLINDAHVQLFHRYKVHVGISVDGPGELNDARWVGTLAGTRAATAKTHAAIERLCREGIPPSLIVTLHRGNATADKLPALHDWFRYVEGLGVSSVRIHILEVENPFIRQKYALTTAENVAAFKSFLALEQELTRLDFDLFTDMRQLLRGDDHAATCVWNACDPYTTRAVQGIEGNGQRTNCGRTNKDGIDFVKADEESFERYLALYHTPQVYNGCQGCRFFLMCKGQCPGTAVAHDWRNRTEHCDVWMALYAHLEAEMVAAGETPLSLHPSRVAVEQAVLAAWTQNQYLSVAAAMEQITRGGETAVSPTTTTHGDHTDHGDSYHRDVHGDHLDHAHPYRTA